ncbi:MAG: M48 family metalloprotease [Rhodoferax sp.]
MVRGWGWAVLLAAALQVGCGSAVVNPVTGQAERSVMSEDEERAQGAQAHAQIVQEYGVVQAPALQAYVSALGRKLAEHSHREQLQWHFTVLDSPEINAFALPGGYVYITRGILAYLDSEAELAGVLGHEIGHVTARHAAQRATRQSDASLGVLAAGVLGAVAEGYFGVGGVGRLATDVTQAVAVGNIAAYGREQELQADALGAEYLSRVRYDPRTMVDVIRVLKAQEQFAADTARAQGRTPARRNDWLSSHPSNDERLSRIDELSAQYRADKYEDEGRARYHKMLAGLTFGDSAAQGLERGRGFYHPGLGFALDIPEGWSLRNEAEQLALVAPAGDAAVLLRSVPPKLVGDPAAVLRSMVQPSQGRTETLQLHGLSAIRLVGARGSQRLEATVVQGPGQAWYLLQFSARTAQAWQQAVGLWRAVEGSFRPLGAQDRAQAQEWALRSVPLPAGGFAELARSSPLPRAEVQLRLLNGYYGSASAPRPGQMVKVVQARP